MFDLDTDRDEQRLHSLRESSRFRFSEERPRLLVSVRSAEEAALAVTGGAEILDVKEPSRGSLGMASLNDIALIANHTATKSKAIPLSIALGEVVDWETTSSFPSLPDGITFAKMGLSHCADNANWRNHWRQVRSKFEQKSLSQLNWVAVAYADSTEAASPNVNDVLKAAIESGCVGLLIDTWTKDGRTLLDGLDESELKAIAAKCHLAGLFFAIAGKIASVDLPLLARIPSDIIAIRSAACRCNDRTSELDSIRVANFRTELMRQFDRS